MQSLRDTRSVFAAALALLMLAIYRAAGFGEGGFARRVDHAGQDFAGDDFGERTDSTGPTTLLDLDYRTPKQQAFPTTAGGVISGRTASEIWTCDEASGNLVDKVGSSVLAQLGTPLYQVSSVGLFDGTNAYSKSAVGGQVATDGFQGPTAGDYDVTTGSFALLVVFRTDVSGGDKLWVKRPSTGYELRVLAGGSVRGYMYSTGNSNLSVSGHDDGAWHCALWVVDRAANKATLITDKGSASDSDISDVLTLANAGVVQAALTADSNTHELNVAYIARFEGADAEGITQSDFDAFWTHATDPGFPVLDTYTRASLACPIVGEDATGVRVAKYGSGQFAHGWDADFSHASQLGALIEATATNLCQGSEEAATGADYADIGAPTNVSNAKEAPDGTQTMNTIAASGAVEGRKQTITVTASTEYTWAMFLGRGDSGVDAFGDVEIYDVTNAAVIPSAALALDFDVDDKVRRKYVTFTTPALCTSVEYRLKVDDGSKIAEWGWDLKKGKLSSYVPTPAGAAASRAATTAKLTNTGGNTYLQSAQGEIEAVAALHAVALSRGLVSANGAGLGDRMQFYADATAAAIGHWDSGGSTVQNFATPALADWTDENTVRYRWDSAAGVDGNSENADIIANGARKAGAVGAWASAANATTIHVGTRISTSWWMDGVLARLRIWDAPRAE